MIRNRPEFLMRKIINKENVIETRFSGLYNNSYEGGLPYEKPQILGMGHINMYGYGNLYRTQT